VRYAEHGWPVVPGAELAGSRFLCGPGCRTFDCHPAWPDWADRATADPAALAQCWADRPHAVLLATGRAFDVLEVSAYLGTASARAMVRGPVAVVPNGRRLLLVRPGGTLRPELASQPGVVLHGPGSWIPAPPTRGVHGRVQWLTTPSEVQWRLPELAAVQACLSSVLPATDENRRHRGLRRVA
jgi:hypothetical protein